MQLLARSGELTHLGCLPSSPAPAPWVSPLAAGRYQYSPLDEAAPQPAAVRAAPARAPAAAATTATPAKPFASSAPTAASAGGAGWLSEPAYVREAALALAADAAHTKGSAGGSSGGRGEDSKLGHLFSRHRSDGENEDSAGAKKQARAGTARARQQPHGTAHDQLLPHAPAFGQGALQKWH